MVPELDSLDLVESLSIRCHPTFPSPPPTLAYLTSLSITLVSANLPPPSEYSLSLHANEYATLDDMRESRMDDAISDENARNSAYIRLIPPQSRINHA